MHHSLQVRVYYEDTDAGGIVYHAQYLAFMERGRTEFLRAAGINQSQTLAEQGQDYIAFVVRHMDISFNSPARLDDMLTVSTKLVTMSGARLILDQTVSRDETALVSARVTVAAINRNGRPLRLPRAVHVALMRD